MPTKTQFYDFLCAFLIFTILLTSITVISGQGFFENAFYWDSTNHNLSLMGYKIAVPQKVPNVINSLLSFNDILFGQGFSDFIRQTAIGILDFTCQAITVIAEILKTVTGAR